MSSRFTFKETELSGLHIVQRKVCGDQRGFLTRLFCAQEFKALGLTQPIAQINHTYTSKKGTVRGLHFQHPPWVETKLVSCIQGKILDVAVDLRQGSKTFLQHHAEVLSADNQTSLSIPDGFAHGFQALTDDCHLLYLHTAFYEPSAEDGLNAQDAGLGIQWPLIISEISERDQTFPMLNKKFIGIVIP
ncbi:dTDP-4-dehydrorhamnose 3,5-epimerase [Desulfobulbus sp. US4]|nr:dTDP-4-dehydrorhamnose 3,5-epimerase [Desulfobulbus sp. US4]